MSSFKQKILFFDTLLKGRVLQPICIDVQQNLPIECRSHQTTHTLVNTLWGVSSSLMYYELEPPARSHYCIYFVCSRQSRWRDSNSSPSIIIVKKNLQPDFYLMFITIIYDLLSLIIVINAFEIIRIYQRLSSNIIR